MMFEDFLCELKEYAGNTPHIESVLVVGSYARGTNKEDSDLDLVIITSKKAELTADQDFTSEFGEIVKQDVMR